jgi:hypothetical protein
VHQQRAGVLPAALEVGHDVLGAPPQARDARADHRALELARALAPSVRAQKTSADGDRAALQVRPEQAHGGLDLGQLGHSERGFYAAAP